MNIITSIIRRYHIVDGTICGWIDYLSDRFIFVNRLFNRHINNTWKLEYKIKRVLELIREKDKALEYYANKHRYIDGQQVDDSLIARVAIGLNKEYDLEEFKITVGTYIN